MSDELFPHAGTLIHGTLRDEDLIPAFMGLLKDLDEDRAREVAESWGYETTPADIGYAARGELTAELMDALNEVAPEGYYFGSIEGDGSDFGFWRTEEDS